MPTFTPTAYALELARARRAAITEAAELVSALATQSGRVQAAALLGLGDDASSEVERLKAELDAEQAAKPVKAKRKRSAPAAPPAEDLPPAPDAAGL